MIIYCWNKSQEEKSTCLKKIYPHNCFPSSSFTISTDILPVFTAPAWIYVWQTLKVCSSAQPCLLQSTHYYFSYNIFIEEAEPLFHSSSSELATWEMKSLQRVLGCPRVSSRLVEAGMPLGRCLRGNFNTSLNNINWLVSKPSSSTYNLKPTSLPRLLTAASCTCDLSRLIVNQNIEIAENLLTITLCYPLQNCVCVLHWSIGDMFI